MRVCVCVRFTAAARWFLRAASSNGNQLRVKSTRQNRYRVWETAKTWLWRAPKWLLLSGGVPGVYVCVCGRLHLYTRCGCGYDGESKTGH